MNAVEPHGLAMLASVLDKLQQDIEAARNAPHDTRLNDRGRGIVDSKLACMLIHLSEAQVFVHSARTGGPNASHYLDKPLDDFTDERPLAP